MSESSLPSRYRERSLLLALLALLLFSSPFADWWARLNPAWYLPYLFWWLLIVLTALLLRPGARADGE